jgi:predicted Zn-dependent peptidase
VAGSAALVVLLAAPGGPARAAGTGTLDIPIDEFQLGNGLRVVVSPDRRAPVVAVAVYYDVGSRDEEKGKTGFAHLFEHMMFQGSKNVGKAEHFQLINNNGGRMNGTTNPDRTNYFEALPKNQLELALWLEADRMRSLNVTAENFENQRQTVKEERRQSYDNRPYAPSHLRMNELAYQNFAYAHSTIGSMADLDRAPLDVVKAFHETYYRPNNAVLAIAGDVDLAEVKRLVEKHFGPIARGPEPPRPDVKEPAQPAEKYETISDRIATLPAFHVAYHVPQSRSPDFYPLSLLATVLGDGESSRLYRKLIDEKRLAQDISVGLDGRRGPDLFSFFVITKEGKDPKQVRDLIYAELAQVAARGITARELQKAKNRQRSAYIVQFQTALSTALTLGRYALFWGDPKLVKSELGRFDAVTLKDVQRVAKLYFSPQNRTVLDVVPARGAGGPGAAPGKRGARKAAKGGR